MGENGGKRPKASSLAGVHARLVKLEAFLKQRQKMKRGGTSVQHTQARTSGCRPSDVPMVVAPAEVVVEPVAPAEKKSPLEGAPAPSAVPTTTRHKRGSDNAATPVSIQSAPLALGQAATGADAATDIPLP